MEIKTNYNIGDLVMGKFATENTVEKEPWGAAHVIIVHEVKDIYINVCCAGAQVFYKTRVWHVEYKEKKNNETQTKTLEYSGARPGWNKDGGMTVDFREDDLKDAPDNLKADMFGITLTS